MTSRDFSYLLRPEIYHQLTTISIPAPFRNSSKQPAAETPIPSLLAQGQFRAAAIASVQALTSSPVSATTAAAHPPVSPTDHARIFSLLYTRLACLCLIDAVPFAAQEAKALEDLNQAFYLDPIDGTHIMPWELRVLAIRLQTLGFGDPRRAVMSYYDLTREARFQVAKAGKAHDNSAKELWKTRLVDLGIKVAGALVEMDDLAGAADHLASLKEQPGDGRLAMSRALLWLHLGDVETARRCFGDGRTDDVGEKVISALADMADGEYDKALGKWKVLKEEMEENDVQDEMIGTNLAVCLLYLGRMEEVSTFLAFDSGVLTYVLQGRTVLEGLVDTGQASHTLLFNLSTMYELCTDKSKPLKLRLAERIAEMEATSQGWEKTNADFKL
jgi:tetratricopeptide (TPR) repeat protein